MHKHGPTFIIGSGIIAIAIMILYIALAHAQVMVSPAQVGIGCAYNTNPVTLPTGNAGWVSCNKFGALVVTTDDNISTYSAGAAAFSSSFAGDLTCIKGSATKTVFVKQFVASSSAAVGISGAINIVRRSTADTGGTQVTLTNVPSDSLNPAGTATVVGYSTAPTQGTLVGTIRAQIVAINDLTKTASQSPIMYSFTLDGDQAQVLRGTSESMCVIVPATTTGLWSFSFEWTEN